MTSLKCLELDATLSSYLSIVFVVVVTVSLPSPLNWGLVFFPFAFEMEGKTIFPKQDEFTIDIWP